MQDLSDPADAGKAAPPSGGRGNTLIAADRRRRTIPVKALPLVPRAVYIAVAGRANEHGIAWPALDTLAADAGTFVSTVRRALDWLIGEGWLTVVQPATPRVSARLRVNLEPIPPAGVAERYPSKRVSAEGTQGERRRHPGVAERSIRGSGARTEDHRKDHTKDHKEDPNRDRAPARGGRGKVKGQTTIAFEPSDPQPKATDGYAQAWVDGNADAGARVSAPTAGGISTLGRAAATHARYRDGEPITGAELLRWIRVKARKFRSCVEDPDKQRSGMTPYGFLLWLDDDPDTRAAPWRRPEEREREAARQPPPPEPKPVYTLLDQERAIKFQRRLQGLPDLAPEELTTVAQRALATREAQTAHG